MRNKNMILSIIGIYDQAHQGKQHLALSVTADGNLSDYAIIDNLFLGGAASKPGEHFFSFPNWPIEVGDIVNLYSCKGRNATIKIDNWSNHDLFWGLDDSVWNENDTAYVLKIVSSSATQRSTDEAIDGHTLQ
jgi:hypothetical protein